MRRLSLLVFVLFLSLAYGQQNYSRVKIFTDYEGLKTLANLGIPVDHGTYKENTFLISDFSEAEIDLMKENGFQIEILIEDVKKFYRDQNTVPQPKKDRNVDCPGNENGGGSFDPAVPSHFNLGTMGGFYKYQEFLDELDEMAALYPNLITIKAPIGSFLTHEGRPIYWVRISDNPNSDETSESEVFYSSIHHAREPNALSEVIFYMWYLLENYATNEEIKYLVDHNEMYFVPCINPDGYIYNETTDPNGGGMHRKNRRDVGSSNKGVDLNRNYSYQWGTTGVSPNVDSDTYPGTGAFTEPETQAIKWFCEQRDFVYAANAHTYANQLLHPISSTAEEFAVDHAYFQAYTAHMVQYNGFANVKSSDMYPAAGESDDYMYKVDLGVKPQIFAMTPEIGGDGDGFWPASQNITGICKGMVWTNQVMAHLPHKYLLVNDTDPSTIETLSGDFHHSAYRLGLEDGPVTVSIEPIQGIQTVGSPVIHDLTLMQTQSGAISFTLDPSIQFGDIIKYVLKTDNGLWTRKDTIVKTYGSLTLQLLDDAANNSNWTGGWSLTNSTYYSASKSFTESPSGDYSNNSTKVYTFIDPINLTNATDAMVTFYAKWEIEADYDMCQFQVSTDNGANWTAQCGNYTVAGTNANGSVQPDNEPVYEGTQADWVMEEINLSDYIGQQIKVRFYFESDGGATKDGFYFDDFQILYNESSSTDGLEELKVEMKAFPNPANNGIYLSLSNIMQEGTIQIVNAEGEIVITKNITEASNKLFIDIRTLSQGMYTVYLQSQNKAVLPVKIAVLN